MMLYIGSDRPLPLVAWREDAPQFHVSELHEGLVADVKRQTGLPHARYAGSYEGCGCGFQLGEYPGFDDEEAPAKRESLTQLAAYLQRQLDSGARIELVACWAGGEGEPPGHRRQLTPSALMTEEFYFLDGEVVVVESTA